MSLLHFPIMYAVMFTMVWSMDEVIHNLNTAYMAGMMVAPMVFLMPLTMRMMYQNRRLNLVVYAGSLVLFLALFYFMREQTLIGDRQFARSMIPHHSGAILMCEKAKLQDAELKTLCEGIIRSQRSEVDQLNQILKRLDQ
ncbi:MAG: DUF305 domain-containing protein [Bdellovibrionaceae bacterium]|nr:DUF305 domain-containing protein [Pseudobdellovibrionaceae bacterium]